MNQYKLKISVAEAHVLRNNIMKMNLDTPEWFELLSYDELAECYNGAGSDHTPEAVRKVLSRLLKFAKEAILVHDADYEYTKRFIPVEYVDFKIFLEANRRLGENASILAKKSSAWYSPLRYWRIFVARHARYICDKWGYSAWV